MVSGFATCQLLCEGMARRPGKEKDSKPEQTVNPELMNHCGFEETDLNPERF